MCVKHTFLSSALYINIPMPTLPEVIQDQTGISYDVILSIIMPLLKPDIRMWFLPDQRLKGECAFNI